MEQKYDNPTQRLLTDIRGLEYESERLKEFARQIIKDYCWNIKDVDGGSVQDLAEKLGLIEKHIAEDVNPEFDNYDVGDEIFIFTEILKE